METENRISELLKKEVYLAPEVRMLVCEEGYAGGSAGAGEGGQDTTVDIKDPYIEADELGF